MNRNRLVYHFSVLLVILLLPMTGLEAQIRKYSLSDIVQIARSESPAWLRAETRKENEFWQFRTYLSDYSPQLNLEGVLPNFTRSYIPVTQPDGSIQYRNVQNNNVNLEMNLSQSIGLTGARVFAGTAMSRFDDFENDFTQYSGSPFQVGVFQPIFQFNQLAWNRKIMPLEYEESQKAYFEELEQISVAATQAYFDVLLAQIDKQIADINVANNDTIYKIAQGRYQLGKIGENELLQLELNLVNSELAVARAEVDLQSATLTLRSFIGLPEDEPFELLLPDIIPVFEVDENVAVTEARKNRPDPVAFQRRILQGQQAVARARGDNGVNMSLFASYGLSNRGTTVSSIYDTPQNSQVVSLNLSVPVLDWGRQKSRRKTAEANLKLIEYQVAQDEINFDQNVLTQSRNFIMLREQVNARKRSDQIGQQAYNISYQLYLIGKISITDLNQSLASKDLAKQNYIQALRDFWTSYFNLRQITLFDFENNTLLVRDIQSE